MFKQLRRRMLTLHLSILTVLLLAVFGILYGSTYQNVQTRINEDMNKLIAFDFFGEIVPDGPGGFSPDRTVSFVILVDEDDEDDIIDSSVQFTYEDDFLEDAAESAEEDSGTFELEEYYWTYQKVDTTDGVLIFFMDITNETIILRQLLLQFVIIFVASFIVVALISDYITRRSILPIRENFDRQKQFIADASHELKTPLTVINTNIDVLLSKTDKSNQKWATYIKSEVERMNKLTHDLLYLANISENEEQPFVESKINVSETIESIVLSIEALAYEKQLSMTYNIEPNIDVSFNIEQFHQVIMILLDNAIKYTNVDGQITVNVTRKNNTALIDITNTGKGIEEDELTHLFDRFYKVDKSRGKTSNSFGLGLSIAKSIIDNHRGKISISSELNVSTTVHIRLKTM